MKNLVIIGNSGSARECYDVFLEMQSAQAENATSYRFKGFLAWKGFTADLRDLSSFFLGNDTDYTLCPDDVCVIGLGKPALRKAAYEELKARGASFINLIHPLCSISPTATLGEANILQRNSTVHSYAQLGNANYLNGAVNLSHDALVGNYNFFGPFTMVLGEAKVGSSNMFGVYSTLLPGAKVGDENMIAPGAFIYKGCKNRCRMAGNPALKIGEV